MQSSRPTPPEHVAGIPVVRCACAMRPPVFTVDTIGGIPIRTAPIVMAALARGLAVVVPRDAHGTYDLDDIPAAVVARVAEHALGDEPELVESADVGFVAPSQ